MYETCHHFPHLKPSLALCEPEKLLTTNFSLQIKYLRVPEEIIELATEAQKNQQGNFRGGRGGQSRGDHGGRGGGDRGRGGRGGGRGGRGRGGRGQ
jgi:hypothetical protein